MIRKDPNIDLRERLLGSLLFDPHEKNEILKGWSDYVTETLNILRHSLDREDELLEKAMKRDGKHITALVEGYVQELNAQAYRVRKATLAHKERGMRRNEIQDADKVLEELTV